MKHTPGPWQLKSAHDPYVVIGNVDGPDDGRYHFTNVCEVVTDDDDEAIANARLIAAAPDLLEALRDCLPFVYTMTRIRQDAADAFEAGKAAIAQATGETE